MITEQQSRILEEITNYIQEREYASFKQLMLDNGYTPIHQFES